MPSSTSELLRLWNRNGQRKNKHRHRIKGLASFGELFYLDRGTVDLCVFYSADSIVNMKFKYVFICFAHGVDWNM